MARMRWLLALIALIGLQNVLAGSGETEYKRYCVSCHGHSGEGRAGLGVSLRDSAKVQGDLETLLQAVMEGSTGTLMVAFKKNLDDQQLSAVINYLRSRFAGDATSAVTPEQIAERR